MCARIAGARTRLYKNRITATVSLHYRDSEKRGMLSTRQAKGLNHLIKSSNTIITVMNTTTPPRAATYVGSNANTGLVSTLTRTALGTDDALSPVALRLALATVIFPHGAQKLLGWWGGYGFEGTMGFFTGTMGIPWVLALGVILVEFFAPLLLLAGVAVRPAALAIGTVLATAMFKVHVANGFFMNWFGNQKGEGIEYFLLVIGIALALVVSGGGRFSLDRTLARKA